MRIHILGVPGRNDRELRAVQQLFAWSGEKRHELVPGADDADLVLVAGQLPSIHHALRCAPWVRCPEKTMIYSEADHFISYLPGVYCSAGLPKGFDRKRTRSFGYLSAFVTLRNQALRNCAGEAKDLLFCFRGQRNCFVRSWLLRHDFRRSDVIVADTSSYYHFDEDRHRRLDRAQQDYADTLARSRFALCPRGSGVGSIRLFEAMEMGVAPVLLSNRYALPRGPDWRSFLVQVPERAYRNLSGILEPLAGESAERGRLARLAWEQYFAPEIAFNRLIDELNAVRRERIVPERLVQAAMPLIWAASGTRRYLRDKTLKLRTTDKLLGE